MKQIIYTLFFFFSLQNLYAQNVGIGTNTPATPLHVFRDADVWHTSIGGNTGTLLIGGQTTTPGFSNAAVLQAYSPSNNTTNNLIIQRDGGNIAIGNIEPIAKLQVLGNVGINFQSDIGIPQLTLTQTDNSYSRLGFKNINGKSFTIASSRSAGNGTDLFNLYSEKKQSDLFQVTTAPEATVKVNGSLVLKSKFINIADSGTDINKLDIGDASIVYLIGTLNSDVNIWAINGLTEGREIHIFNMTFNINNTPSLIKLKHYNNLGVDNIQTGNYADITGNHTIDNITLKNNAGCVLIGGGAFPGSADVPVWRCSSQYIY